MIWGNAQHCSGFSFDSVLWIIPGRAQGIVCGVGDKTLASHAQGKFVKANFGKLNMHPRSAKIVNQHDMEEWLLSQQQSATKSPKK